MNRKRRGRWMAACAAALFVGPVARWIVLPVRDSIGYTTLDYPKAALRLSTTTRDVPTQRIARESIRILHQAGAKD